MVCPHVIRVIADEIVVDAVLQAARLYLAVWRLTQVLSCAGQLRLLLQGTGGVYLGRLSAALSCFDRALGSLGPTAVLELLWGRVVALGALHALLVERRVPVAVVILEEQVRCVVLGQQGAVERHLWVLGLRRHWWWLVYAHTVLLQLNEALRLVVGSVAIVLDVQVRGGVAHVEEVGSLLLLELQLVLDSVQVVEVLLVLLELKLLLLLGTHWHRVETSWIRLAVRHESRPSRLVRRWATDRTE